VSGGAVVLVALIAQVPAWLIVRFLWRSHVRCYEYAVARVNERDITDPEWWAYNDMASVIALDGDVTNPRHPATPYESEML
jgi:hypothetical protein